MVYEVGNFNPPFANPEAVALQGQAQWKAPERHTAGFESDPADWQQSPLLLPYNLNPYIFRVEAEDSILEMIYVCYAGWDTCAGWVGRRVLGKARGLWWHIFPEHQGHSTLIYKEAKSRTKNVMASHAKCTCVFGGKAQALRAVLLPWCLISTLDLASGCLGGKIWRSTHVSGNPGPSGPFPLSQLYVVKRNF